MAPVVETSEVSIVLFNPNSLFKVASEIAVTLLFALTRKYVTALGLVSLTSA